MRIAARRIGVLLTGAIATARLAAAASCGGAIPCQCGDIVIADYALTEDMGPCAGDGLLPQSGVVLDCLGFAVQGPGDGAPTYGIHLKGVSGVVVQNCVITGFQRGIRLRDTSLSSILGNTARQNGDFVTLVGYGIDLAVGAVGNLIENNLVIENADEGIHVGTGSADNELVENVVWGNSREQIYILGVTGTRILRNLTGAPGTNSLYLKDSADNYLEGNAFADRVAVVTGNARNNTFVGNDFIGTGLQIRVYEATPNRIPTGNVVLGGSIQDANTCLRFRRSSENTVADVVLSGCGTEILSESTTTEPSMNTVVGVTLDPARVSVDASSRLDVGWWFTEVVRDAGGAPVAGATIHVTDAAGAPVLDLVSDGAGSIPPQILLEYVRTGAGTTAQTPHTVVTTGSGYVADMREMAMNGNAALEVQLVRVTTSTSSTSSSSSTSSTTSSTTSTTRPRGRKPHK